MMHKKVNCTSEKFADQKEVKVIGVTKRSNVNNNQGLVMINLYVKFNVHSSNVKQVIVVIVADRQKRDDNRHPSYKILAEA